MTTVSVHKKGGQVPVFCTSFTTVQNHEVVPTRKTRVYQATQKLVEYWIISGKGGWGEKKFFTYIGPYNGNIINIEDFCEEL